MARNFWIGMAVGSCAALACAPALAEDLAAKVVRHKASCPSIAEACPIRQPEGFGGWTQLGSGADLDGHGDWWLAKFSKDFGGKIRLADGNGGLHEISVAFGGARAAPKAAKPASKAESPAAAPSASEGKEAAPPKGGAGKSSAKPGSEAKPAAKPAANPGPAAGSGKGAAQAAEPSKPKEAPAPSPVKGKP